jgi:SAM-dependent methyltransferase
MPDPADPEPASATERHARRGGFDADAAAYQRTRPVGPPEMFDDLVRLARLSPGDRVVEIGCGTGQATVPLAERGLAVTAIELGPALAQVARRRLAGFPHVEVVTSSFEDWPANQGGADAVVAINCLHWIDPAVRYAKPAGLLKPDGAMVVGGWAWARPEDAEPFWAQVQEDYRAVGFEGSPPPSPAQIEAWHFPAEASQYFEEVASLRYPFQLTYSAGDYLAQLATQSGTRALGAATAERFLSLVRSRLEAAGWPSLTATFVGRLAIASRRGQAGQAG